MTRYTVTPEDLARGYVEPDPHNIEELGPIGLEAEEGANQEEAELEAVDILQALREMQTADPLRWNIERVGEADPEKNGFLARWSTTQLTQERVRDEFGGGNYRIRGIKPNGRFAIQRTITIAGDAPRKFPGGKVEAQTPHFDMAQFFAMMDARDRAARRETQEREAARELAEERSRKSRNELITILAPLVAPMGAALVTGLVGRPAAAVVASADPIANLKGLAELMVTLREFSGSGNDSGDSLVELVKAVAPHAGPVLAALVSRPAAAPPPRRRLPPPGSQPTPAPAPTVQVTAPVPGPVQAATVVPADTPHTGVNLEAPTSPETLEQQHMFAQLKPHVDSLVQMAREGAEPVAVADMFFSSVLQPMDDNDYNKMCVFLENPLLLTQLAIFNTGVKDFRVAFFEPLQKRIIELIAGEDNAAQNETQAR